MDSRTAEVTTNCAKCENSIEIEKNWTAGGMNDYGGYVLRCLECDHVFEFPLGRDIMDSRVVKGAEILDTYDRELDNKADILKKHGLAA
jgi:hypothetical protein